ncbi:transcription factor FapR [Macrococcoides caseolyticum]|uniref:transcription factor FapR n=1 Tax=Macrococcoides caseolyticum TaxID=69966 RepID=UPI001F4185AA|nr:transcription factor FapR [Macrococcus caseolyticus]MCE4956782.1 transcription factor FapR [Macrococcus caseolyticus]
MKKRTKKERQALLAQRLTEDPFLTDEDLSKDLNVSIQTIRLDRLEQNIPELRERIKDVAVKHHDEVRALPIEEIIGEVIDLELDHSAISILDIKDEHVFYRNKIARGHYLFAQANSLCVAVINDELALTVKSEVAFKKPVKLGDRVITKATVLSKKHKRAKIEVVSTVKQTIVFTGVFEMYYTSEGETND